MADPMIGLQISYQIEAGVVRNHDEAVQAWCEGRLPTIDPPTSSIIILEGSGS